MTSDPDFGHHEDLSLAELRNVIALEERGLGIPFHCDEDSRASYREYLVEKLERAKREVEEFDRVTAWRAVMRKFGWECFDVSDHVAVFDKRTYVPFVGTREELGAAYPALTKGVDYA